MKYFIRKINSAKFPRPDKDVDLSIEDFQADAVADIKTNCNTLSIWEIESLEEKAVDEAIFALVTNRIQHSIDKIDFVVISEEELRKHELNCLETDGDTLVEDLKSKHRDIVELTYGSIRDILEIISEITKKGNTKRRTKGQIKAILKENINRIENIDYFDSEGFKEELRKIEASVRR